MKRLLLLALAAAGSTAASAAVLSVSADASTIGGNYVNANFGTSTYRGGLFTGSTIPDYQESPARFWLKFQMPAFAPGTQITSATLYGYHSEDWNAGVSAVHDLHVGGDGWTEGGLTRNNEPSFGAAISSFDAATNLPGNWVGFDITSAMNAEYQGDGVLSLVMTAHDESAPNTWEYFASRESNAQNAFYISYNVQAVPEPASMAALGLGAFGLIRRRRKS